MLRAMVVLLLAFALTTVLDVQAAVATAIPTPDLSVSRMGLKDDDLREDLDQPISPGTSTADIDREDPADASVRGEELSLVEVSPAVISIAESFALSIAVKDWQAYQGGDDCNYFGSELHDPKRIEDECGNVEPGSDYSELISVLELTTVSVLSFSLGAAVWLLHRSYRNRRLRNIAAQRTLTNPQLRKRRRRAGGSISG